MSSTCEYIKRKWGEQRNIELAKEVAKAKARETGRVCGKKDYEQYKGYVNKWLTGKQEPGKEYLVCLSKILNVSVESILMGEDIVNEYGDRPTAYSAALSGDEHIIERLFENRETEIYLDDKDEYAKSFVDYVVEYNKYQSFKIAITKGYNYPHKYCKTELSPETRDVDNKLTQMIVENDDMEMFEKIFGYMTNVLSSHAPYGKHQMTEEITFMILKSQKILRWFMKSKPFSLEEWREFNENDDTLDVSEKGKTQHIAENMVDYIPSVPYGFNKLLNKCVEENLMDTLEILLDFSLEHMQYVIEILGDRISDFVIDKNIIQLKDKRWYVLGFVPYTKESFDNAPEKIRAKVEKLNHLIDRIGK